jgi:hypothetical protein
VAGTSWGHQRVVRDALQAIVSDPQLGVTLAQTLMQPAAGPAPEHADDSIL